MNGRHRATNSLYGKRGEGSHRCRWCFIPVAAAGVTVALAALHTIAGRTPPGVQAIGAYLAAAGVVFLAKLLFRYRELSWENAVKEVALAVGLGFWTALLIMGVHHFLGGEADPIAIALVVSLLFMVWTPADRKGKDGDRN